MIQTIRQTTALLLAAFFLVSFTGMRLLVHHCMGCDTTGIVFAAAQPDCCGHAGKADPMDGAGETACCALPGPAAEPPACGLNGPDGCCRIEVVYLKNDAELASERPVVRVEAPALVVLHALASGEGLLTDREPESLSGTSKTDPPPRLTGREFILFSHHLKIAS